MTPPKLPPKKLTAIEAVAQQTNTRPEDWTHLTKSSKMYRRGFRYVNLTTKQYAKRLSSDDGS